MKIICIGRNYAKHATELGNALPTEPVIFLKPETALIPRGHAFFIPEHSADVHHEVELVIRITRVGRNIEEQFAHRYYDSIGIGIDFTCRDVQQDLKAKGLPWEKAKAFDHSAPVGQEFVPVAELRDKDNIQFSLKKNGETVQTGESSDMVFSIDRLISEVSKYFTLKIGDLLFTGTPEGVGPIAVGDLLEGYIEGKTLLSLRIK